MSEAAFEPSANMITLDVDDVAHALSFYETKLVWKASPASRGNVVFFQASALAVVLFPRRLLTEGAGVSVDGAVQKIIDLEATTAKGTLIESAGDRFCVGLVHR